MDRNEKDPQLVFCFGNELVKEDSLAPELADELEIEGYKFVKLTRPEQLLEEKGHLFLLDVVKGITKVQKLSIEDLKEKQINTLHDFDLQFFLQLMKKIGTLKEVTILGLPMDAEKEAVKEELKGVLR
ncbi:MAG: hypothetical protein KC535_04975 [Nanoarchaeota archaeon]|nr:hypothetical protein [Nanoarchaeota archaeon]